MEPRHGLGLASTAPFDPPSKEQCIHKYISWVCGKRQIYNNAAACTEQSFHVEAKKAKEKAKEKSEGGAGWWSVLSAWGQTTPCWLEVRAQKGMCQHLGKQVVSSLLTTQIAPKTKTLLGLVMRYSVKTTNHESLRNRVDERRRATLAHMKQQDALRLLDGLAANAQLSAADLVLYAVAVERLFKKGAFKGWRSRRHQIDEVRCCGVQHRCHHQPTAPVHRGACAALLP